jgi:hypothetical protein
MREKRDHLQPRLWGKEENEEEKYRKNKTKVYYIRALLATNKGFKTCPPEIDQR